MFPKLKKLSVLIIAAVLLVAMAFAGAASADVHVTTEQQLKENLTGTNVVILDNDIQLTEEITIIIGATPTLDLSGHTLTAANDKKLFIVSNGASFTLNDSSSGQTGKLTGGHPTAPHESFGGGVYVETEGTFTMKGGNITGCSANNGGGVYVHKVDNVGGTFIMTGGTITGCSAIYGGGGGVYVEDGCNFKVNGSAVITGNTGEGGAAANVNLVSATGLQLLAGGFTGKIGIFNPVNGPFGTAEEGATGAENFTSDGGGMTGFIDTTPSLHTLKWKYTAANWNALDDTAMNALSGTVYIVDPDENAVIYPKFNSTPFNIANTLTLDFTGYKGKFAGEPSASSEGKGALFGNITNSSYTGTLTIKNLTMKDVKVASSSGNDIAGIIGYIKGNTEPGCKLNFTNCRLVNCSIAGTGSFVGGLVGYAEEASVNVENCNAKYCDVMSSQFYVGGLVGDAKSASFVKSNVTNSTVASTGGSTVGGLVGGAHSASFDSCGVENTSISAVYYDVGGLVGDPESLNEMASCNVENCVIASGSFKVGGLVGSANSVSGITNSAVTNTAVNGTENVSGLIGMVENAPSGCSNNAVKNSAVKGTAATVHLDCGSHPGQVGCTATDSYLNNGTAGQPTILVYPHTVTSQPAPEYFKQVNITKLTGIGLKNAAKNAAAYVFYEKTPAVFNPDNRSSSYSGNVSLGDTSIAAPVFMGYTFNSWNLTSADGTMLTDNAGTLLADITDYTNASGQWNNASGIAIDLHANWTVNKTTVTATETYAKFGNDNVTAINQSQTKVVTVVLENVTQISSGNEVTFIADNSSLPLPELNGYTRNDEICVFEIEAPINKDADYSSIVLNITFDTATTASENKDKVVFLHYNTTRNTWDTTPLVHSLSQSGNKVEYLVHTTSFSPFGVGIYTKNSNPTPSYSSSSRQTGYTQILQEVPTTTPTPTPTPTAVPTPVVNPTANPTTQPTQSSPAPLAGLIAGLGAAALIIKRLRK